MSINITGIRETTPDAFDYKTQFAPAPQVGPRARILVATAIGAILGGIGALTWVFH
jgi:hypothetical protein